MKKIIQFTCFLGIFLCIACSEESNNSLLIADTLEMSFTTSGGSQTFNIESNTDWTIKSNETWVSTTPSHGSQNQAVTVNVAQNDEQLARETQLVIHTNDGEKTVNISIKQQGVFIPDEDVVLRFISADLILNGSANSIDSVRIVANTKWELKGPEWLEAYDGNRWRTLQEDRGVITGNGNAAVYVRTRSDNKEIQERKGMLTLSEQLTGEHTTTVFTIQVGRMTVMPHQPVGLCTGIACEWTYGCDVKDFYYTIQKGMVSSYDASDDEILETWNWSDPTYINGMDGLDEGGYYTIITRGRDAQGNLYEAAYLASYYLPTSQGQPLAPIEQVFKNTDGLWYVYTSMNEYTLYYLEYVSSDTSLFNLNDPLMTYILYKDMVSGKLGDNPFYDEDYIGWIIPENSEGIQVITWGMNQEGRMSGLIDRYINIFNRDVKGFSKQANDTPKVNKCPKSILQKQNFKLIKRK